jgi:hypothetical protein
MAETNPSAERESALRRGEMALLRPASRWIQDALTAWADNDYGKVSLAAPLAVELLGKAVLWNASQPLLVPPQADAEASLFILVERPDLDAPKRRTIGLKIVLGRLETLLGGLPIDGRQRTRMIDTRNGAMHIGSAEQSRFVLIEALTLCVPLLARLGKAADWFYGDHKANADGRTGAGKAHRGRTLRGGQAREGPHAAEAPQGRARHQRVRRTDQFAHGGTSRTTR